MNGHSLPVSMEQPARLLGCTASEASVLAAGPWGSEQEAPDTPEASQPHQGMDLPIKHNGRGLILGAASTVKQSTQHAPPKETYTAS